VLASRKWWWSTWRESHQNLSATGLRTVCRKESPILSYYLEGKKSFFGYLFICHRFFLLMETTFTTLNIIVQLKVYYMCVREKEHFLQLQNFASFTSASSRFSFLFCFFLGFVYVDFFQPARLQAGISCWRLVGTCERLDLHLGKMGIYWGSTCVLSSIWMCWTWKPIGVSKVLLSCAVFWAAGTSADTRCCNGYHRLMDFSKAENKKSAWHAPFYAGGQLACKSLRFWNELVRCRKVILLTTMLRGIIMTKSCDLVFEPVSGYLLHFAQLSWLSCLYWWQD